MFAPLRRTALLAAGSVDVDDPGEDQDDQRPDRRPSSEVPQPIRLEKKSTGRRQSDPMGRRRAAHCPAAYAGSRAAVNALLNIIWLVFAGIWLALGYALAGLIMCITIIGIPIGIAAFRMTNMVLWPFGRTAVKRGDAGAGSAIGNVLWFLLCGWWLIIGHLLTAVAMAITIIGIPLALANVKLIPITLTPFGRDIVSNDRVMVAPRRPSE